jgi:hypothetical protein
MSKEANNVLIEAQSLTTCDITPDSSLISISFVDSSGQPTTIRMSLDQVGALMMTLPGLIDHALQTRFADSTLRYTYPLASWTVEQASDPNQCLVTLQTADGYGVCFSIPREQQIQLSEALAIASPRVALRPH